MRSWWKVVVGALLLLLGVGLFGVACGGGGDSFKDSLTFGTAIGGTGFDLVGESNTFSLATDGPDIWFRLESAQDIKDRFVRLYIYSGSYPYAQKDYIPPQNYGHILLSSFRVTDAGSYTVKSYLVETILDIGKENHVIDAPLTLQP
jgi:hypothetical protein